MEEIKLTGDEAKTPAAEKKKQQTREAKQEGCVYTLHDLIAGHKTFGVPIEIAAVALKLKGIEQATFAEAKKIIDEFKDKEVK